MILNSVYLNYLEKSQAKTQHLLRSGSVQYSIVGHVCPNIFNVSGPILRHLGVFGKCLLHSEGKYTVFADGGLVLVLNFNIKCFYKECLKTLIFCF